MVVSNDFGCKEKRNRKKGNVNKIGEAQDKTAKSIKES